MQVLTFLIDGQVFAMETKFVEEIKKVTKLTKVPKARREVKGLINLRGYIIPVINIRILLNFSDGIDGQKLIIAANNDDRIAFTVDDVDEMIDIDEDDIQLLEDERFRKVIKIGDSIGTLIEVEELFKI